MVAILSLSPVSQTPDSRPRPQTLRLLGFHLHSSSPTQTPDPRLQSQSLISFPLHSYGAISSATSPGRWRHLTCHVTLSLAPLTHGLLPPSLCPRSCLYKQQLPRSFPPSRNSPPITALLSLPLRPSSSPLTSPPRPHHHRPRPHHHGHSLPISSPPLGSALYHSHSPSRPAPVWDSLVAARRPSTAA